MTSRLPGSVSRFMNKFVQMLHKELPVSLLEGVYVYGSIALGAFNEKKSDIDFIVLLKRSVMEQEVKIIRAIHSQMNESAFGKRMDGVYVQVSSLGKTNKELKVYPFCEEGKVKVGHWDVNHITWWILKEYGITLHGTPISELQIPISWKQVEETLHYNVNEYWFSKTRKPHLFLFEDMVEFTICTISRIICSNLQQDIVSKDKAIEVCLEKLPKEWHLLLKEGARIRKISTNTLYRSKVKRAIDCRNYILYTQKLYNEKLVLGE